MNTRKRCGQNGYGLVSPPMSPPVTPAHTISRPLCQALEDMTLVTFLIDTSSVDGVVIL